jgi:ribosomal protein S18 acetylase RimI-like enzyme
MIKYTTVIEDINEEMLHGFFVGWPNPPSKKSHMKILKGSYLAWVAVDSISKKVVGFITAVSDGVLSAYIPLVEVLPEYQRMGIGKELITRMLDSLKNFYMVDLLCDKELQSYYAALGMTNAAGSFLRNYNRQNCED